MAEPGQQACDGKRLPAARLDECSRVDVDGLVRRRAHERQFQRDRGCPIQAAIAIPPGDLLREPPLHLVEKIVDEESMSRRRRISGRRASPCP